VTVVLAVAALMATFAAAPAPVAGATAWRISAAPRTMYLDEPTQVKLTVTGGVLPIGVLTVTLPGGYTVTGASIVSVAYKKWAVSIVSASQVRYQVAGEPRLIGEGDIAVFAVTVVPTSTAGKAWTAAAFQKSTTSGASCGPPAAPLGTFTVLRRGTPAPPPVSTPVASAVPSASPTESGSPEPPAVSPEPSAAAGPDESASPERSPSAGGIVGDPSHPFGSGSQVEIPALADGASIDMGSIDGLEGLGLYAWMVPGFLIGLPGLLILLVALMQAIAGGMLMPVARRALGGFGLGRKPDEWFRE
jgi:hypothetical protein